MTDVLGYGRYGATGGTFGCSVTQKLTLSHPEWVVGIHLTDIGLSFLNAGQPDLSGAERAYVASIEQSWMQVGARTMLHLTKPQTLTYGLTDSPVGLPAWLVERFRS